MRTPARTACSASPRPPRTCWCRSTGTPYRVFGYRGKQVRDNLRSADLVSAFEHVARAAPVAAVYNIGGGRELSCSVLEAIALCERVADRELQWTYVDQHRMGDHMWWISDLSHFRADHPEWALRHDLGSIVEEILDANRERWRDGS